jgi:hypothetical protein
MRKLIKASVLTLALAIPAWAGDMGNPVAPPPLQGNMGCPAAPPSGGRTAQTSPEPEKTGEMGMPSAADVMRTLLQSLLSLV